MGSFRDFLEVFDRKKSDVTISEPFIYDGNYHCQFRVGDEHYEFLAQSEYKNFDTHNGRPIRLQTWVVGFYIFNGHDKYGITGNGRALEVFQVVMQILKNFLTANHDKVDAVEFSAVEISRKILYLRMIQRYSGSMGFHLLKTPISHSVMDADYVLVKDKYANLLKPSEAKSNLKNLKQMKSIPNLTPAMDAF